MKKCSHCKKTMLLDCFYKDNRAKDGLQRSCKECLRLSSEKSYKLKQIDFLVRENAKLRNTNLNLIIVNRLIKVKNSKLRLKVGHFKKEIKRLTSE